MKQFKIGDTVRRIAGYHSGMSVGDTAKITGFYGPDLYLEGYAGSHTYTNFELVQDENVMYLKKNWSLSVNNENVEAYKQTLIALGYNWNQYCRGWRGQSFIRSDEANSNKVLFSNMTEDDHFEDIEEFLKFHFLPQKTESQLKLEELQKIIEDAQNKIEQLKQMK